MTKAVSSTGKSAAHPHDLTSPSPAPETRAQNEEMDSEIRQESSKASPTASTREQGSGEPVKRPKGFFARMDSSYDGPDIPDPGSDTEPDGSVKFVRQEPRPLSKAAQKMNEKLAYKWEGQLYGPHNPSPEPLVMEPVIPESESSSDEMMDTKVTEKRKLDPTTETKRSGDDGEDQTFIGCLWCFFFLLTLT